MNQTIEWKKTQPGSTEAVQFSDGMLVTAEDLTAAMRYPLSVIQVLIKAYFGCGVVCGLGLRDPTAETKVERNSATGELKDPNFILIVDKGVALGCDGYPIEICSPLKLDLTRDPCCPDKEEKELFIAARRVTAAEAAARACGCGSTGGEPALQCTRMRDHALVQAFDRLPAEICQVAAPSAKEGSGGAVPGLPTVEQPTGVAGICACLKKCGECACYGESWVLLGTVMVTKQGGLRTIDESRRRYVKPLACVCDALETNQPRPAPAVEPSKDPETAADEGTGDATAETAE